MMACSARWPVFVGADIFFLVVGVAERDLGRKFSNLSALKMKKMMSITFEELP